MATKSKTSLFLIELILMVLFFSLSAAICMRVFADAQVTSRNSKNLSNAALKVQSAAECYKATGGDFAEISELLGAKEEDGKIILSYASDWSVTAQPNPEFLLVMEDMGDRASIEVSRLPDGKTIFSVVAKAVNYGN